VRGVEPGCETSVPGIDGDLVPDPTDLDPAFEQATPHRLEVGHDEINIADRSRGLVGRSLADLYRARRSWRRAVHDAECVCRPRVDIEREAKPIDIKPQRAIDITRRQRDHLD